MRHIQCAQLIARICTCHDVMAINSMLVKSCEQNRINRKNITASNFMRTKEYTKNCVRINKNKKRARGTNIR